MTSDSQDNPDTDAQPAGALRSRRWFADTGMRGFAHRQRMQQMGLRREDVLAKPCIAIVNTWSDLSPCHAHLRERAESIKQVVLLEPLGAETLVTLQCGAAEMVARLPAQFRQAPGTPVTVYVNPAHFHLFDAASGAAI